MNTVKCPVCGNENINTNIKCEKCGEQLISQEQIQDIDLALLDDVQDDPVDIAKAESFAQIISGIGTIIVGGVFSGVLAMAFFKGADNITKIVSIPFLICGVAVLIYGISTIIKGININKNTNDYVNGKLDMNKVEKSEKNFRKISTIVNNIYVFGFLLFWFGFLIVFDISAIKYWSNGGDLLFFFSIIFWIVGIYLSINKFKK